MKRTAALFAFLTALLPVLAQAQAQSLHPGINAHYEGIDFERAVRMFESEGREVYDRRRAIVAALRLAPGMRVADVGAGTGLFTWLFAEAVGSSGRVHAADISPVFVHNIGRIAAEKKLANVQAVLGGERDARLPPGTLDLVFLSDTYHHFEYPQAMLASIRAALRPGGLLAVIDYERIPGVSSSWVLSHVRAGKADVIAELKAAGFRLIEEPQVGLRENYFLLLRRMDE